MTVLECVSSEHRSGRHSVLAFSAVAVLLTVASHGRAEKKEDTTLGSEYIDMPEGWKPTPKPEDMVGPEGDERKSPGYLPGYSRAASVGLSPHAPQMYSALPGGVAPSFGLKLPDDKQWGFSFSGYMQGGFRGSLGKRDEAYEGQKVTTFHGDGLLPGASWGWFDHSATVPGPWAHLAFQYGNEAVQATAIIGAWNVTESMDAAGYFQVPAQQWFNQAFLNYTPKISDLEPIQTRFTVGAYKDRYGAMSKYTEGAYGATVIAAIGGVGTTATVKVPFEYDIDLNVEGGLKGTLNKAPVGMGMAPENEHARAEEGSTYAGHGHAGLTYKGIASPTLHYVTSWSQDDRPDPVDDPATPYNESQSRKDGSIDTVGADVRLDAGRFGYFYLGGAKVDGENANSVSKLVTILNTGGGKEFMEHFWGYASNGNGTLWAAGSQYTLSLGTLLRYPTEFWGEGPDLVVSAFGMAGRSNSAVNAFDKNMYKYGTEVTYSMLSWLAASGRFDHVIPDTKQSGRQFAIVSPKLIFRSEWNTREALTLQYAYYFLGSDTIVQGDTRLLTASSGKPDRHLVTLFGTMWW